MSLNQFYQRFGVNLDLALEAHELLRGQANVRYLASAKDKEQYDFASVTNVVIMNPQGARPWAKTDGKLHTIVAPTLSRNDPDNQTKISQLLSAKLDKDCCSRFPGMATV
jgi:spore protease